MGREGVAEQVRIHIGIDPLTARPVGNTRLHGSRAYSAAPIADKQCRLVDISQPGARQAPLPQCSQGLPANRDNAILVALTVT